MNTAIQFEYPTSARKQSPRGIISLLAALGGLLLVIALGAIGALVEDRFDDSVRYEVFWGRMTPREEFDFLFAVFGGLGMLIVFIVGAAIGILGAFQKERKRLLASLGIALNAIFFLVIAVPWILYLALWLLKPFAWH